METVGSLGREFREFLTGLLDGTDSAAEQANTATLRELYRRFNDGRIDAMAQLLTDDYESVDIAAGETSRGPVPYVARQKANRAAMPDARTEIVSLLVRGDVAIAEVLNRGTNTGPFQLPDGSQLPPTGRTVEGLSCEIYRFRDGRIAQGRLYYDFLTVARQLGLPL